MKFNSQMLMQLLSQRNPQAMQQLQQFQQMLNTNTQLRQQYNTFRTNLQANPQLKQQAINEATARVNNLPPVGGNTTNQG